MRTGYGNRPKIPPEPLTEQVDRIDTVDSAGFVLRYRDAAMSVADRVVLPGRDGAWRGKKGGTAEVSDFRPLGTEVFLLRER